MQKKIIALAVAAMASGAAFAQSNVTVYGIADVAGVVRDGEVGKTRYAVDSGVLSTSRLGFKGVEDLGNGLKALFTLEYGLTMDQNSGIGAGPAMARQQFVGLTGGFGTAVAGRLQTTGLDFTVAGTALGSSTALGAGNVVAAGLKDGVVKTLVGAGAINAGARADNAIAYISPSFGGVTVALNHARHVASVTDKKTDGKDCGDNTCLAVGGIELGANSGKGGESSATLASVNYENGPMTAGVVVSKLSGIADNVSMSEWGVRAGYDFGIAKLQGTYQEAKLNVNGADPKEKKYVLSATVPVTAKAALIAEYAKLSVDYKDGVKSDGRYAGTVAATYSLSKRTTAYAGVVLDRQDNNFGGVKKGVDTTVYAAGVRHAF